MTYEGPLDLLLDEVRRQKVAIEQIDMAPLAAHFLDYVRSAGERNLNLDIEWLHMAATLIHWKSRVLLPNEPEQADPVRDEVVQQLLTHRRRLGEELGRRREVEESYLDRQAAPVQQDTDQSEDPPLVTAWDLIQQARHLAGWIPEHRESLRNWPDAFGIEPDEVTVAEMTGYLRNQIANAGNHHVDGESLLRVQPTASRRACLFLGILEMVRDGELHMEQSDAFGPIWLIPFSSPSV